jgi:serine/threonine protein kinase/Tol biopolymer transport system component
MAITTGSRIGPYEVTSQLGEGGMGVVFRARDTKLLRNVAIKVLPDHLADDPDRLSRLQREAQLLASLNHPNIAQIYGLEEVGGTGCIVMELVEGDTLSDRLAKGPLSVDEATTVAKQIAEGLAAAHERGVIHRDLKPANIKLTPDGTVKILDFGLAKVNQRSTQATQMSAMPTKVSGSIEGLVVGTAAYMSPEQARGKEVDARTDIWAFGCVLYEMLTGKQAFAGETFTDIVARVVTAAPDMNLMPAGVPAPLRLLLEVTLNKNQAQRLQHIADVRLFLDDKLISSLVPAAAAPAAKPSRIGIPTVVLLVLFIGALIPAALYFRAPVLAPQPQMRFEVALPPEATTNFSVSPNGQYLAYTSSENGAIWVRSVASDTPQKLAGTENATGGGWSTDGLHVFFIQAGKLKKTNLASGAVQTLCDAKGRMTGLTSNRDGVILIGMNGTIMRTSDSGGEVKTQVQLDKDKKEQLAALPVFLPDGNHFLFALVNAVPENSGIFVGSLDSNSRTKLLPLGNRLNGMAYAPQGYLVVSGAALTAQRFDLKQLSLQGEPIQLADAVDSFSVSDTGLLLFHKGAQNGQNQQLTWFSRSGEMTGKVSVPTVYGDVEVSPKGDRVAVDIVQSDGRDVWAIDIARNVPSRITFDGKNWSPSWSPDGNQLIFSSSRDPLNHIYRKSSTGAGSDELMSPKDLYQIPVNWSSDGKYIVYSTLVPGNGQNKVDTWVMENFGERKTRPFLESKFDKAQARISPDSRFLAYATNDTGIYQIMVQTFPDPNGGKWQITADGGIEPKWRRDGRELYYLGLDGKMMAVQVKPDRTFGTPSVLFQTPLPVGRDIATPRYRRYDVAPDGRFLIAAPVANSAVVAVVNWTSGLGGK